MTKEEDISVEYLRTRLRYEPETGKLFWLDNEDMPKKWRARWAGKEASSGTSYGYRQVTLKPYGLMAHRVCWALYHGGWPSDCIDHINGIRVDNRIVNLRVVSKQENQRNMKKPSNNTSGVVGVRWESSRARWFAYISLEGVMKNLGRFNCLGQALKARREAEERYEYHANHGKR